MKPGIPPLLLFIVLLAACRHSSNLPGPTAPPKNDSVTHASAPFVPYTDTFAGVFRNATYWTGSPDTALLSSMTDSAATFYIIHQDTDMISIRCPRYLICDTFKSNKDDYYLSGTIPSLNIPGKEWQVGVDTIRVANYHNGSSSTLYFNREGAGAVCADFNLVYTSFVGTKK